jgi:signal transduction histidine kinase
VRVDVCGIERDGRLAPDVELAIFRIAQEAVSNARRHSAASSVLLRLAIDRTSIALTVADDGCGFRPDHAMAAAGRGEGLPGMRERASLLGGEFAITSTPGAGTRVAVTIPLLADETGLGEGEA